MVDQQTVRQPELGGRTEPIFNWKLVRRVGGDDRVSGQRRGRLGSAIRWNPKTGKRPFDELVWGVLPHGTKDPKTAPRPINARAETVATHSMFAAAFRDRRAIVPMTVYYHPRGTLIARGHCVFPPFPHALDNVAEHARQKGHNGAKALVSVPRMGNGTGDTCHVSPWGD